MQLWMINSLSDHFLGGETLIDENQIKTFNHLAKLLILHKVHWCDECINIKYRLTIFIYLLCGEIFI